MRPVIIGTAGHIDHGKSSLVRALTGTDPDRLKEEKERGITIDLGYAFLDERIAFIDVPGHERFIKNMVAGVTTVDIALLIVAADDGVMPQTREHFDILQLLGLTCGAVAITKLDMADPDWVDMVEQDVRALVAGSFLEDAPILRVDSLSGRGVEDVRGALVKLASGLESRAPGAVFRLPVDRVFTVKGFGTVVTGSVLSGSVALEDRLVLLPRGLEVRVRGIETQGHSVTAATAGMRLALNLPQVTVSDVERGDILATPESLRPSRLLDAEVRILPSSPTALEQRQRVRLHIGTKELLARCTILGADRLLPGEQGLVQWLLEEPYAAGRLDRYVIRRYSPQITIGGGRILDAAPKRHRKRHMETAVDGLTRLADNRTDGLVLELLAKEKTATFETLLARTSLPADEVETAVANLLDDGEILVAEAKGEKLFLCLQTYLDFESGLVAALRAYHEKSPLRAGAKRAEVLAKVKAGLPDAVVRRLVELAIANLTVKAVGGELLAAHDFEVALTKKQRAALEAMDKAVREGRFQPPDITALAALVQLDEKGARDLLQVLVDRGELLNLEGKIYFHAAVVEEGVGKLRAAFAEKTELAMSDFRVLVDTSRKYAVPLLNYYDAEGYTLRREDLRARGPKLEPQ